MAGDIGPSGEIVAPLGTLEYDEAVDVFREQAASLVAGGVDLIWIETMSDLNEIKAAIQGVRQAAPGIALVTTMTFDTRGYTMMGVSPEDAVRHLAAWGADAIGGNCGNGPDELIPVIAAMRAVAPDVVLVAKSNAGMPELVDMQAVYRASPEVMAGTGASRCATPGARIVGACCGSTPDHLAAMAAALAAPVERRRRPIKVGIQLPEVEREVRWPELLDLIRAIEDLGFDSIWLGEHLLYRWPDRDPRGPWEAWTLMGAIAAVTSRVDVRAARGLHQLPQPGAAGQAGGDDRRDQRWPASSSVSAPAGTRPSSGPSASRSTTASTGSRRRSRSSGRCCATAPSTSTGGSTRRATASCCRVRLVPAGRR